MQAFLYRHLIPAQEFMVATVGGGRTGPTLEFVGRAPLVLVAGSVTPVRLTASRSAGLAGIELELNEPPKGITIEDVAVVDDGVTFNLKAAADVESTGTDNLIIEAFAEIEREGRDKSAPKRKVRVSLGALPAIPCEIVRR